MVMARWALGSDDCILPASLLCLTHSAWLLVLLPLTATTLTTQTTTDKPSQVSDCTNLLYSSDLSMSLQQFHYECVLAVHCAVYSVSVVLEVLTLSRAG